MPNNDMTLDELDQYIQDRLYRMVVQYQRAEDREQREFPLDKEIQSWREYITTSNHKARQGVETQETVNTETHSNGSGHNREQVDCPTCHGTGKVKREETP